MISRVFANLALFSTAKYEIVNGKYLLPSVPKRSLSSYLLFSNEARKSMGQSNVTESSKLIAEKWKALTAEEKQKYENKAKELRQQYEVAKAEYDAKFKTPFKRADYNGLLMRDFYSKNKFASLAEGSKAFQAYKKNLKEEDLASFKKQAEETNARNEKVTSMYEIPEFKYKDINAYLRQLRKQRPDIPRKDQLEESAMKKIEKAYDEERAAFQEKLKAFAASFHMKLEDLVKLINKEKDQGQKLSEEGQRLKDLERDAKKKANAEYLKEKKKLEAEKSKILKKSEREAKSKIKKLETAVEKKKRGVARISTKFSAKLIQNKRSKLELELAKKAEKDLKAKKVKDEETEGGENKEAENKQRPKAKGRPKKVKAGNEQKEGKAEQSSGSEAASQKADSK